MIRGGWQRRPDAALAATLGGLAAQGGSVHFSCAGIAYVERDGERFELHTLKGHYGFTLTAAEAAERWGAAATLADLRRRARCTICDARDPLGIDVGASVALNAVTVRDQIGG
jgi:hypothetical protein